MSSVFLSFIINNLLDKPSNGTKRERLIMIHKLEKLSSKKLVLTYCRIYFKLILKVRYIMKPQDLDKLVLVQLESHKVMVSKFAELYITLANEYQANAIIAKYTNIHLEKYYHNQYLYCMTQATLLQKILGEIIRS